MKRIFCIIVMLVLACSLCLAEETPKEITRVEELIALWNSADQTEKQLLRALEEVRVKKLKIQGAVEEYNWMEGQEKEDEEEKEN